LGDFQQRANKDRRWGRYDRKQFAEPPTPSASVRVPNVGWDSTPRVGGSSSEGGWGRVKEQRWDATPVAKRGGDDEEDGYGGALETREWEEEQVKLDRDWYMTGEEGGVVREWCPVPNSQLMALPRSGTRNTTRWRNTKI
jgi:pre-mRNA-splicing factor ATP-dependent RNA helicase DHX38/PRP16